MIKYEDLKPEAHPNAPGAMQAKIFFPNGYGASVISGGDYFYTDGNLEHELAVIKGSAEEWSICYETPITSDVIGHLLPGDVERVLNEIAALEPATLLLPATNSKG